MYLGPSHLGDTMGDTYLELASPNQLVQGPSTSKGSNCNPPKESVLSVAMEMEKYYKLQRLPTSETGIHGSKVPGTGS